MTTKFRKSTSSFIRITKKYRTIPKNRFFYLFLLILNTEALKAIDDTKPFKYQIIHLTTKDIESKIKCKIVQ